MNEPQPWSFGVKFGLVAGVIGVVLLLLAIGAVAHLGPFEREQLTQGELLAQGDEICRKAHAAFDQLQDKQPQTPDQAETLITQLINIAQDERDRIAELNGPPEFDDEVQTYLDARDLGIQVLKARARGRRSGTRRHLRGGPEGTRRDPTAANPDRAPGRLRRMQPQGREGVRAYAAGTSGVGVSDGPTAARVLAQSG